MRKCTKCGIEKELTDFYLRDGKPISQCKACAKIHNCRYYKANSKKVMENTKAWQLHNLEIRREIRKRWYRNNKAFELASNKQWRRANRVRINEVVKLRMLSNPALKLIKLIRKRVWAALKGIAKHKPTILLLGGLEETKRHLESQFKPGMTWENYGPVWHVDHIRPCASFDLSLPEQQKICFHYTNLQPLLAFDNLSKGAKYDTIPRQ